MPAERILQSRVSQNVIQGLRPVVETIVHTKSGTHSSRNGYELARQGYWSKIFPYLTGPDERVYVGSFLQTVPVNERPLVMNPDFALMLQLRYGLRPSSYGQEGIDGLKAIASGKNLGNPDIQRLRTPMQEVADVLSITFGDGITRDVLADALATRTAGNIGTDADRESLKGIVAKMTGGTANTALLEKIIVGLRKL